MSASEVVLWASLAALNLALAALVAATRPRRTVHGLVVVLFVSNAILAALRVAHEAGVPPDGGLATRLDLAASAPSIAVLAVLPWLLTQRGPSAGRTRALLGLAAALVLANWTILAAWADADVSALHSVVTQAPLLLGVALGGLVLLDAYLAAPSHARRGEAMLFLAAYELKASTSVAWFLPGALGGAEFGGIPGVPLLPWVALLLVPALAAPISLLLSRLRGHAGAPRPLAGDALVLGFLLLGLGLPYAGSALDLEYLLARPLLFAAGILSYGLLDIELRARRGLVAATIFAGMGAVLVVASQVLEEAGAGLVVAVTVGVITALGVGAVLAWPTARLLLAPASDQDGTRARSVYRALLEEAISRPQASPASNEPLLRALRTRLGISEREHALIDADVRATLASETRRLQPGRLFLGRYRVEAPLGAGAGGRAFLARDETMGRRVVLKAERGATREEHQRLVQEARTIARFAHPHVVTVFDVEEVAGECVLVLEHVEGGSLAERLQRGPLPLREALRVADDVLAALQAAHAAGVVHRDVKPANILLTRDGRAKLADFGVARDAHGSGTASASFYGHPGTVRYMSPEQVRGLPLDGRSDLYALAAVLYEALAGRSYLDFRGLSEFDCRLAILEDEPSLPLRALPAPLNRLLAEALAKDAAKRPRSAAEMRRGLAQGGRSQGA